MNEQKIQETATKMLAALETPIDGGPCIKVLDRANAERLMFLVIQGLYVVVQNAAGCKKNCNA